MTNLRRAAIATLLLVSTGCSTYSSTPVSPSPVPAGPTAPGGTVTVTIVAGAAALGNRAYSPDAITVSVGDTVTWTNADTVAHTSTADAAAWNSGTLAPGQQFSTTLSAPGTFPFHCAIHPGMVGTVIVR